MAEPQPVAPASGSSRPFPCPGCGASLAFDPGAQKLTCPYCGFEQALAQTAEQVDEQDYQRWLASKPAGPAVALGARELRCGGCGAITATDRIAQTCPFCGASLLAPAEPSDAAPPEAVLPFRVAGGDALDRFKAWLASRWFAPSGLRQLAAEDGIRGVYVPHFTFDARTRSFYRGQRGEHYYETVIARRFVAAGPNSSQGRWVEEPRQVQRTRWWPASGTVDLAFDDVLVLAMKSLPNSEVEALAPWDLKDLAPFAPSYLAGFEAARPEIGPEAAFDEAREAMSRAIEAACRADIGGDEQRVESVKTSWSAVTFKHVLLPAWLLAYRFAGKVYRVFVNARTGEVCGERPWSWVKIALLIVVLLIVAAGAIVLLQNSR